MAAGYRWGRRWEEKRREIRNSWAPHKNLFYHFVYRY
jgi:hypothetical protein